MMKELHGESAALASKKGDGSLMSSAADWRNPHQTYTNKYDRTKKALIDDNFADRKERKANELASNVLTHEDESLKQERLAAFDRTKKRDYISTNSGWNA